MISVKTIANRFLANGIKPKISLANGSAYAGYGIFNEEKGGYEIPVQISYENNKVQISKWELDHTPINIKLASFSFIGTLHELETLCKTDNATVQHHVILDEYHSWSNSKLFISHAKTSLSALAM